jgi:hypothetical protein
MQPYFLPYRNYFGLIRRCDEFVVFDDVQFCHNWQQRNCIPDGRGATQWLTIPVVSRRPFRQRICDVLITDERTWRSRLLERVRRVYHKHPCYDENFIRFAEIISSDCQRLVEVTVALMQWATVAAGLKPPLWHWSSDFDVAHLERNERLIELCRRLGATHYVSGPAAKSYMRTELFEAAGIQVIWHEESYGPYPQLGTTEFNPFVSILDLLMNHGARAHEYLRPLGADSGGHAYEEAGESVRAHVSR